MLGDPQLPDRFWAKVRENPETGCWEWMAARALGYGRYAVKKGMTRQAHRVAYEALVGKIPDDFVCDHLCRVRSCVNPAHIEIVTIVENVMRGTRVEPPRAAQNRAKTHCPHGHEYSEENTYRPSSGQRMCRACRKKRDREAKRAKRRQGA